MTLTLRLLGALLALCSACTSGGESGLSDREKQLEPSSKLAAFALAYPADEGAIARAQETVRQAPEDAAAYQALAEAFLVRKRETSDTRLFALAKDAMAAARFLDPKSSQIRTSAVQLLFEDHQFTDAAAETRELIANNPTNVTAHLLLSDALVELGDYEGAVLALESAMELSPDLRVYARGSYLRWLDGDREGAMELMVDAIEMGSATHEAVAWCLVELGTMQWHASELGEASKAAASALALIENYPPAIELSARIARSQDQDERAIQLYQELLTRRETVAARIALSELLRTAGRNDEAQGERERAELLAEHDPLALVVHDARHKMHPEETLQRAKAALDERSNIYTRDAYALALLRAGKAQAALETIGPELLHGSLDASLWLHRGLILAAAGELETARDAMTRALALSPSLDPQLVAELRSILAQGVPR